MDGTQLLDELKRRVSTRKNVASVTDAALAEYLGVTQPALGNYRGKKVTSRQIANLMDKFAEATKARLINQTIVPIVEFLPLGSIETSQGKSWQVFSTKDTGGRQNPYLKGLRERLEKSHGIYVFYDSRGRAIYAGKAQRLSLWTELNNAFNRNRGEIQSIKRVSHPNSRVKYKGKEEGTRKIVREQVALHHLAEYVSAYEVPDGLTGKIESLIVRCFANDLLNVRMENF